MHRPPTPYRRLLHPTSSPLLCQPHQLPKNILYLEIWNIFQFLYLFTLPISYCKSLSFRKLIRKGKRRKENSVLVVQTSFGLQNQINHLFYRSLF